MRYERDDADILKEGKNAWEEIARVQTYKNLNFVIFLKNKRNLKV